MRFFMPLVHRLMVHRIVAELDPAEDRSFAQIHDAGGYAKPHTGFRGRELVVVGIGDRQVVERRPARTVVGDRWNREHLHLP